MLEAEIWGVAETSDGYVIFVRPMKSKYSVPIFIGQLEAQAILIGFGGISISRPLTADLLQIFIKEADFELIRIEIGDLKDSTFFGSLVLKKPSGGELIMDSRPSDALALAVLCKSPIYIDEKVVEKAGIIAEDLTIGKAFSSDPQGSPKSLDTSPINEFPLTETAKMSFLQQKLDEAVEAENYERAAEIRDMLKSIENDQI